MNQGQLCYLPRYKIIRFYLGERVFFIWYSLPTNSNRLEGNFGPATWTFDFVFNFPPIQRS